MQLDRQGLSAIHTHYLSRGHLIYVSNCESLNVTNRRKLLTRLLSVYLNI